MARCLDAVIQLQTIICSMYLFVLRFQIANTKLYEFNLAIGRLVKWPVYVLHNNDVSPTFKTFEMVRNWDTEALMKKDLKSAEYENLVGAIKVLGEIKESNIYNTIHKADLLQEG